MAIDASDAHSTPCHDHHSRKWRSNSAAHPRQCERSDPIIVASLRMMKIPLVQHARYPPRFGDL
jgi:hypothetical protein